MKIQFTRSGGFAGIRLKVTVDTDTLPAREADQLRKLIADAALLDQPALLKSAKPEPDRFQYQLSVEEGDLKKDVRMDESAVPEAIRPLLDFLVLQARK